MDQTDATQRSLLQAGILAARAKRKTEAYGLLRQAVQSDPASEQGWLWLAAVAPTPQESLDAFGRVLEINPANEQARVGQRWARARLAAPAAPAAPAPSPTPAAPAVGPALAATTAARGFPAPPLPAPPPAPPDRVATNRTSLFAPVDETAPGPLAPAAPPFTGAAAEVAPATSAEPDHQASVAATPPAGLAPRPGTGPLPPLPDTAPPFDWRAGGDLAVPAGSVDGDDDGADVPAVAPAVAPAGDPALDPSTPGVVYRPAWAGPATETAGRTLTTGTALAEPAAPATGARAAETAAAPSFQPVGRRSNLLPLLIGAFVLVAGLLLAGYGLVLGSGDRTDPEGVTAAFFQAHLAPDYNAAAVRLAANLRDLYLAGHDLPNAGLAGAQPGAAPIVHVAPLATAADSSTAETMVSLAPPAGGAPLYYRVHLAHETGTWLIDQILPVH